MRWLLALCALAVALCLDGCAAPRGNCPPWHLTCGFD
jgi:hypothetical protein